MPCARRIPKTIPAPARMASNAPTQPRHLVGRFRFSISPSLSSLQVDVQTGGEEAERYLLHTCSGEGWIERLTDEEGFQRPEERVTLLAQRGEIAVATNVAKSRSEVPL